MLGSPHETRLHFKLRGAFHKEALCKNQTMKFVTKRIFEKRACGGMGLFKWVLTSAAFYCWYPPGECGILVHKTQTSSHFPEKRGLESEFPALGSPSCPSRPFFTAQLCLFPFFLPFWAESCRIEEAWRLQTEMGGQGSFYIKTPLIYLLNSCL